MCNPKLSTVLLGPSALSGDPQLPQNGHCADSLLAMLENCAFLHDHILCVPWQPLLGQPFLLTQAQEHGGGRFVSCLQAAELAWWWTVNRGPKGYGSRPHAFSQPRTMPPLLVRLFK